MKNNVKRYMPLFAAAVLAAGCDQRKNRPPVFTAVPDQTVQEGEIVTLPLEAYDPEKDPVALTLVKGPGSIEIAPSMQYVYQDAEDLDLQNNRYGVEIKATDSQGYTARVEFTITQEDILPPRVQPKSITLASGLEGKIVDNFGGSYGLFRRAQTAVGVTSHPAPMVVYQTASTFPGTTIVSGDLVSAHPAQQNPNTPWIIKQIHPNAGSYLSFQFDSDNNGHLAFDRNAFSGGEDLVYALFKKENWSVGEWSTTLVQEGNRVGLENDLALDINGKVYISHLGWVMNTINYATNATSTTKFATTSNIALADWNQTSITVDQNNVPHIAFSGFNNKIEYITRNPMTRTWSQPQIVAAGSNPVIRRDGAGLFHIMSQQNGMLQHSTRNGSSWTTTPLLGGLSPENKLAATIDTLDNSIHVGLISQGNLWYARGDTTGWKYGMLEANCDNPAIAVERGNIHMTAIQNNNLLYTTFSSKQFLP